MTLNEITRSFFNHCDALNNDRSRIKALCDKSGTSLNLLSRVTHVYWAAYQSKFAEKHGIVGVGLITYAESRTETFLQRVQSRFGIQNLTL